MLACVFPTLVKPTCWCRCIRACSNSPCGRPLCAVCGAFARQKGLRSCSPDQAKGTRSSCAKAQGLPSRTTRCAKPGFIPATNCRPPIPAFGRCASVLRMQWSRSPSADRPRLERRSPACCRRWSRTCASRSRCSRQSNANVAAHRPAAKRSAMNFGWIALDECCRIVELDAQAERLLERMGSLRRGPYDRLVPAQQSIGN